MAWPPIEPLKLLAVSGFRFGLPISPLNIGSLANSDSASGRRNEVPPVAAHEEGVG